MITYRAITDDNRQIAIDCATLDEALDLAAAHLGQGVSPVAMEIAGRRIDSELILALLDQREQQKRQARTAGR